MEAVNRRLQRWWQNASPTARRTAVGLLVAVVFAGTFLLLTDSPAEPLTETGALSFGPVFYLETLLKLVGVLLLIVGSALVFRRWWLNRGFSGGKGRLAVVETVRMSPRQALHLVRVGEQYFLVGATDQSVGLIAAVSPADAEPAAEVKPAPQSAFQPLFAAALKADSLQSLFTNR